jgi:HAD superfamily hydrolase (TIGR01509 family)
VLRAVLFDWGHTLMNWTADDEILRDAHRAGLEALAREDVPDADSVAEYFRLRYEELFAPAALDEVEYPGIVRALLGEFGVAVTDEELGRYLEAEHAALAPARQVGATTHALLDSLRARGLRTGLVSNAFDPPWLLHRGLEQLGIAQRLDVAVFSSEVGKRKPHPEIFGRALTVLGVEPAEAVFVGDSLFHDIRGASQLGMTTVQALWFRVDDNPDGAEPDFQAFTPFDVLNFAERLVAA